MSDLKGVYNASNHPDVKAGKKTEDEILCEFLDTFEMHHALAVIFKIFRQVEQEEILELRWKSDLNIITT